jgi:GTPase SAR1 family protein
MGGVMSSLFPLFDRLVSGKREYRILMLGLDAAGKSMICIVSVHERGR